MAKKTQVFPNFRKTQGKKVPKSGFFASFYYISFQKTQKKKKTENSIFRDFQFFSNSVMRTKKSLKLNILCKKFVYVEIELPGAVGLNFEILLKTIKKNYFLI